MAPIKLKLPSKQASADIPQQHLLDGDHPNYHEIQDVLLHGPSVQVQVEDDERDVDQETHSRRFRLCGRVSEEGSPSCSFEQHNI
jgi:hypothetical protein